jgi:excinuclease ABC subunit C
MTSQRACLRYHLGKCVGVCEGRVSVAAYRDAVSQAVAFLSHSQVDLIRQMKRQMVTCAEKLEFEKAQRLRDQVEALESALEPQIVERDVDHDQDAIYFGERKALVMQIERGAVQGMRLFDLEPGGDRTEACERFLLSRYAEGSPRELIVNGLGNCEEVERTLAASNGYEVKVERPVSGDERELLKLCERNYAYRVSQEHVEK